jgi:hypothetical protein
VVQISDPTGDLDTLGNPELAARFQSVDLTNVAVAVAGSKLCVDFTAKAPPDARTFYIFSIAEPGSTTGPSVSIDVNFLSSTDATRVALKYPGVDEAPDGGVVPAQVAVARNATSLVIDRQVLPRFAPFPVFAWSAEGVGQTGLRSPQQVSDSDVAPGNQLPSYP